MPIRGHGLVAAETAVTLTIGRARYTARAIGVATMLRVQMLFASPSIADKAAAVFVLLHAAFPDRPRWRRWRDPIRQILRLDAPTQQKILTALMAVPGLSRAVERDDDPYAATRAWQRAAVRGDGRTPRGSTPSLELAARTCRAEFGEAWYYNPERYQTTDGTVPHAVCWVDYLGLDAIDARRELRAVRAETVLRAATAHAAAQRLRSVERRAFPSSPSGLVS